MTVKQMIDQLMSMPLHKTIYLRGGRDAFEPTVSQDDDCNVVIEDGKRLT